MSSLVPLPVLIPLGASILLVAINGLSRRWFADTISIAATGASAIISLLLAHHSAGSPIVYWYGAWTPRSGIAVGVDFYVDPLSAGLAAFICVLAFASFVFSLHYFDSVGNLYHALMLGFVAAMCGFSLSGDLFNLFVFFELMSVAAFALCGYKTEEPSTQQGAINFAVLNTIGGFLSLLGLGMFYSRTGALNMPQIGRALANDSSALVVTAFTFVVCGFLVKAAVFPFHFWLADAHAVAPTPVCVLFSGVMVELGVYAVARVYWVIAGNAFAPHHGAITGVFLTIGGVTALLGAFMCFVQRHIKRLLAFSTISHAGLMIIGFALLKPEALAGTALYVIGHGAAKGSLFLVAGILLHRFGSIDEAQLYGRARHMRWTGLVFLLGGLALAGLVPYGTFLGGHAIEIAAGSSGKWVVDVILFVAGAVTAGAVLRVYVRVFLGRGTRLSPIQSPNVAHEQRETEGPHHRVPTLMFLPAFMLLLIAICAGCIPGSLHAVRSLAFDFTDVNGYQARVLDGQFVGLPSLLPEHSQMFSAILRSFGAVAFALFVAGLALSKASWTHLQSNLARKGMDFVRGLHSGKVGDYVAYFTFGVAGIGIALAILIAR